MIPPSTIRRVKEATHLPGLFSDYTAVKKTGPQWTCSCLFHNEKTASLKIWPDHYHCFGCGASGDAISFLSAIESIPFSEALQRLADRSGVEVIDRPSTHMTRFSAIYAAEEAAFCRWWVEDRKACILRLANSEAEDDNGDLAFCDSLANLSAQIRSATPRLLFQLFLSLRTGEDRTRWRAWTERERRVESSLRSFMEAAYVSK